jgi:hypothetical protein
MSLMNGNINMTQPNRDAQLKNSRAITGSMVGQIPDASHIGQGTASNNALYQNISLDRNTSEITGMLKQNPYVVDFKGGL